MANSPQAKKRARQAEKRRQHNASRRSEMRTYIKQVRKLLEDKDAASAKTTFVKATSMLDKLASKGMIHANKASRLKSRLAKAIKKTEEAA